MRVFIGVICLLNLFRVLACIADLTRLGPRKLDTNRVVALRAFIGLALFLWGSWALWARA